MDVLVGERGLVAHLAQALVGVPIAAEVGMQPALVAGTPHAAMGEQERRAHAVLVEQVSKICQNLIGRPFDVDGKADGVWIKAARPLESSHHHEHRWDGRAYYPRASYTKVNSRGAAPMRPV